MIFIRIDMITLSTRIRHLRRVTSRYVYAYERGSISPELSLYLQERIQKLSLVEPTEQQLWVTDNYSSLKLRNSMSKWIENAKIMSFQRATECNSQQIKKEIRGEWILSQNWSNENTGGRLQLILRPYIPDETGFWWLDRIIDYSSAHKHDPWPVSIYKNHFCFYVVNFCKQTSQIQWK